MGKQICLTLDTHNSKKLIVKRDELSKRGRIQSINGISRDEHVLLNNGACAKINSFTEVDGIIYVFYYNVNFQTYSFDEAEEFFEVYSPKKT